MYYIRYYFQNKAMINNWHEVNGPLKDLLKAREKRRRREREYLHNMNTPSLSLPFLSRTLTHTHAHFPSVRALRE